MFREGAAQLLLVLVGESDQSSYKKFGGFNTDQYPDRFHVHPHSPKLFTVRKFMKELFKLQGVEGWATKVPE